ncbi:DUF6678 family protein [Psychrobacillus sp. MER TA 171]|uniref:DUF6678 family protein n=1 Tax=Psychrobacillus sp. MER TA 171 TaxID=2939577 RepID=UPI00203F301D|nr:DUF6678 family protein [Psychrobacillus sp. MER TA 171]MCM3360304.1 hypothetical protein [Psychrobacillus sp. MER TA 171]
MSFAGYQSLMNDTKWEEIWLAMIDIPELIYWRQRDIETNYTCDWDAEWFHHFKTNGDKDSYKTIEWLEIKFENEEIKNKLLKILKEIHVPGEVLGNTIKVYGYIKEGTFMDYI